jgi:hypothetical protein
MTLLTIIGVWYQEVNSRVDTPRVTGFVHDDMPQMDVIGLETGFA